MTREELIAALEKAEWPSQKLDREIALQCGWKVFAHYGAGPEGYLVNPDGGQWQLEPPRFTESIDAALTLVPDGRKWMCGYTGLSSPRSWAFVEGPEPYSDEVAASPAIALCIAALKARGT